MNEDQRYSRGVQIFGMLVKGLVRYGWLFLVGILLIAGLLEWAPWRTLLAIGIAGALVIALSPMVYGATLALDSRRRNRAAKPAEEPPNDASTE